MRIETQGPCLSISEIPELTSVNSSQFSDRVRTAMKSTPAAIEVDLSQTRFVDSRGLSALLSLYQAAAASRTPALRILNPIPEIRKFLELTQMHHLFEIVTP